ncbi:MAG: hypothetical protein IPO22_23340 [Anaerolineales bacterium]|nr:hypothetical protein [Anaerolineales bacterium]
MRKTVITALFILGLMLTACGSTPTESAPAAPTTDSATETSTTLQATEAPAAVSDNSQVLFQIVKADGTTFDVTLNAVKALPLAQLQAEGKVEEGPYLSDVLALAGVTEFTEVTLTGSSNPATLTFEQVNENTILDFNNHGTMKLSSTYIPKANWTKDVSLITVK